jgi:hypothetical protein
MKNVCQRSNWEAWLYGLAAAFIGGGAGSVTSGLASMGIDPEHFNLQSGLSHTFALMGAAFLVNGLISSCLYLRQSPIPGTDVGKMQAIGATARQ